MVFLIREQVQLGGEFDTVNLCVSPSANFLGFFFLGGGGVISGMTKHPTSDLIYSHNDSHIGQLILHIMATSLLY